MEARKELKICKLGNIWNTVEGDYGVESKRSVEGSEVTSREGLSRRRSGSISVCALQPGEEMW